MWPLCPPSPWDFHFQASGNSTPQFLKGCVHEKTQAKGEKMLLLIQPKAASGVWPPSSVLSPSFRQTDWGGCGALSPGPTSHWQQLTRGLNQILSQDNPVLAIP